jgi:PA14 domain/FecR protein
VSVDSRPEEWTSAYAEGTLSAADRVRLTAWVGAAPEREAEFVEQLRLHLGLSTLLRRDAAVPVLRRAALIAASFDPARTSKLLDSARALRPLRARRPGAGPALRRLALALAACVALLVAGECYLLLREAAPPLAPAPPRGLVPPLALGPALPRTPPAAPPPILAEVAATHGGGSLERAGAPMSAAGAQLQAGDILSTADQGGMELAFPGEGTRVTMLPATRLALLGPPGKRFRLLAGALKVNAAAQSAAQPMRIETPRAELTVVGTAFTTRCNALMTWLEVEHGAVRMGSASAPLALQVSAGQRALAGDHLEVIPQERGSGLLASYHDGADFERLALVRIDPCVDFDWADRAPDQAVARERFSVRWSGEIEPRFSETYRFSVASDDGARLWIDGRLVIDNWRIQAVNYATPAAAAVVLTAHRKVRIRLDYFEFEHLAAVRMCWESRSQPFQVVPQQCLFPSPP